MSKKIISLLMIVVLGIVLVLAGCTQQPTATTTPAATTTPTITTTTTPTVTSTPSVELPPIKIGVVFPITGTVADQGKKCRLGAEIMINEINKAGGIGGRKLEMVFADDESQPAVGVAAFEKLIVQDKVDVICGTYNSSVAVAAQAVAAREKCPFVVSVAASTTVTQQNNPYLVRTTMSIGPLGPLFGSYMMEKNPTMKKIALIRENTDYGIDFCKLVKTQIGNKLEVIEESYNPGDTDFYSQLTKIKNSGAQVLFMTANITEGSQIAKQRKELGLTMPFYASGSSAIDEFYKLAGPAADGLITLSSYDANTKDPKLVDFIQKYKAAYNLEPDAFVGNTADSINVIKAAIENAYKTNGNKWFDNQAALRDAINTEMHKLKVQGLLGLMQFNSKGDTATDVYWVQWQSGGKLAYLEKTDSTKIFDQFIKDK